MAETKEALVEKLDDAIQRDAALDGRSIHERMIAVLDELPAIGKDQRNEQQKFMYRGHDDVMAALNPLLGKHGIFLVPEVLERQTGERQTRSGGLMYEVNLRVRFRFYGPAGDYVDASAWGEGTDSGDKSTNKAMTMAFKNVLAVAFAISTHELSDADASSPEETVACGGSAGGRRTASKPSRDFDPGIDLRDDAPSGEGFQAKIAEVLEAVGPTVDWRSTFAPLLRERFHVETRQDLEGEKLAEYWRRVANLCGSLSATADLSSFPPLVDTDEGRVKAALGWAFGTSPGAVEIVRQEENETAEAPPGSDIPWVDEVQAAIDKEKELAEQAAAAAEAEK